MPTAGWFLRHAGTVEAQREVRAQMRLPPKGLVARLVVLLPVGLAVGTMLVAVVLALLRHIIQ